MEEKVLILSNDTYYSWDENNGWKIAGEKDNISENDYINEGLPLEELESITEGYWKELESPIISYYTDDSNKEDVIIETEVEPFTIYDEMGDSMEVLYYTDDEEKEEVELEITANYSPLDELDDFEVVTWTDDEDADLTLKINALPVPQFVYQLSPANIYGFLQSLDFTELGEEVDKRQYRILLSDNKVQWKTWDKNNFIIINHNDFESIKENGMATDMIKSLTKSDWEKWENDILYLGVLIIEKIEESNSYIDSFSIIDLAPTETTQINDAKLYILNTKSTINVSFEGGLLNGTIDDQDLTRVQYRVFLNDKSFYPIDGTFTELQPPPLNINLKLTNRDFLIDEENTLRVEFQDYWGSTDYWETTFIGTYNGLLFLDETGEYYSSDIGEVLKYLDFGEIVSGQTTLEHKIVLKNTYGVDVQNIKITANQSEFPDGLRVQFGTNEISFEALNELILPGILKNGEEFVFYIRLASQLGGGSKRNGRFDIIVTAEEVV